MEIKFTVPGEPKGKGRPRAAKRGEHIAMYTPKGTADYENEISAAYRRVARGFRFSDTDMFGLEVKVYQGIPKSASKAKRQDMLSGRIRPTKKPDIDNILKIVMDALNMLAYKDDRFVVISNAEKFYSDTPRLEIRLFNEW